MPFLHEKTELKKGYFVNSSIYMYMPLVIFLYYTTKWIQLCGNIQNVPFEVIAHLEKSFKWNLSSFGRGISYGGHKSPLGGLASDFSRWLFSSVSWRIYRPIIYDYVPRSFKVIYCCLTPTFVGCPEIVFYLLYSKEWPWTSI